jgi:hypothetical protein
MQLSVESVSQGRISISDSDETFDGCVVTEGNLQKRQHGIYYLHSILFLLCDYPLASVECICTTATGFRSVPHRWVATNCLLGTTDNVGYFHIDSWQDANLCA